MDQKKKKKEQIQIIVKLILAGVVFLRTYSQKDGITVAIYFWHINASKNLKYLKH